MLARMFHRGWERSEAKLVDKRFVKKANHSNTLGAPEIWEYMVELEGRDGKPVRLTIREKSFKVVDHQLGVTVPVLVNPPRTEAVFDLKDPRIDAIAARKAKQAAQEAADKSRFDAKLKN